MISEDTKIIFSLIEEEDLKSLKNGLEDKFDLLPKVQFALNQCANKKIYIGFGQTVDGEMNLCVSPQQVGTNVELQELKDILLRDVSEMEQGKFNFAHLQEGEASEIANAFDDNGLILTLMQNPVTGSFVAVGDIERRGEDLHKVLFPLKFLVASLRSKAWLSR